MKENIKGIAGSIGCCLVWAVIIGGCLWGWDQLKQGDAARLEAERARVEAVRSAAEWDAWSARQAQDRADDRQFRQRRDAEWRHQEEETDRMLLRLELMRPLRY